MRTSRWGLAAGVTFGAIVLLVLVVLLPAVYRIQYQAADPTSRPRVPQAHAVPTAEQKAVFDRYADDKPGLDTALQGRDGYVFLGDAFQANVTQALGWRHYSPAEVVGTTSVVRDQQAWLADRGITSAFVVVPAKWAVYADKLPEWTVPLRLPTTFDQLREQAPETFLDLRPTLDGARATAPTYSRLNSHWTDFGADVGFRALLADIQRRSAAFNDVAAPPAVTTVEEVDRYNEFEALTGQPGPNDWAVPSYPTRLPDYEVVRGDGSTSRRAGDEQLDMLSFPLQTRSEAPNEHRVLVLGDSTTSGVSALIAQSFSAAMFVRHQLDVPKNSPSLPALVDEFEPDLVVTLVSERNLKIPLAEQRAQWKAALAFDETGGSTELLSDSKILGTNAFTLPLTAGGGGGYVLRLTGSGPASSRITFATNSKASPKTARRVGPGEWRIYVEVGPADTVTIRSSKAVTVRSVRARSNNVGLR